MKDRKLKSEEEIRVPILLALNLSQKSKVHIGLSYFAG